MAADDAGASMSPGSFVSLGSAYLNAVGVEERHQVKMPFAGTFSKLGGYLPGLAGGDHQLRFRKNADFGVGNAQFATGWFEDPDGEDALVLNDKWCIGMSGGLGGEGPPVVRSVFTAESGHSTPHVGWLGGLGIPTGGYKAHWSFAGSGVDGGGLAESRYDCRFSVPGTLFGLHGFINGNDAAGTGYLKVIVNGIVRIICEIPGGYTGPISNFVDSFHIDDGDLVHAELESGLPAFAGLVFISQLTIWFTADEGFASDIFGNTFWSMTFSGRRYGPIGGTSRAQDFPPWVRTGFPAKLKRLRFQVVQNERNVPTTLGLYIEDVGEGNNILTVPALTNGWFEADVLLEDIVAADQGIAFYHDSAGPDTLFKVTTYGVQITDVEGGGEIEPPTHETPDLPTIPVGSEVAPRRPIDVAIENQRWLIRTPHVRKYGQLSCDNLRLTLKRGLGTSDTEPAIWVRANRDNKGFGNWVKQGLGFAGDRMMVKQFGSFGCAHDWQFEIATTDDCEIELRKLEILPTPLGHR